MNAINITIPDLHSFTLKRRALLISIGSAKSIGVQRCTPDGAVYYVTPVASADAKAEFEAEKKVIMAFSKELLPQLIRLYSEHLDRLIRENPMAHENNDSEKVVGDITINGKVFEFGVDLLEKGKTHDHDNYWKQNIKFILASKTGEKISISTRGTYHEGPIIRNVSIADNTNQLHYNTQIMVMNAAQVQSGKSKFPTGTEVISLRHEQNKIFSGSFLGPNALELITMNH